MVKYNILINCKLSDSVVINHILPLSISPYVNKVTIIRTHRGISLVNIKYYLVTGGRYSVNLKKFFTFLRIGKDYDIFWSYYLIPHGIVTILAAKLIGKKCGTSIIGTDLNVHIKSWYGKILIYLLDLSNIITVTGTKAKQYLIDQGIRENKIIILPNTIDIGRFKPLNLVKIYDLLFVGSLIPIKRVDILLQVVAYLKKDISHIRCAIVGSGPLEAQLKELTNSLQIENNVEFVGYKSNTEYYFNSSKILIMTSDSEGLPLAMIEAMCCGCVPVVPDVGDISDVIINGYNGILVKTREPINYYYSISNLLRSSNAFKTIQKNSLKIRNKFDKYQAKLVWDQIISHLSLN